MRTVMIDIISLWDGSTHNFTALTDETETSTILETVFFRQQDNHKDIPGLPSLCAGDIICVNGERFLCMNIGWKRLTPEMFCQWSCSSELGRMSLARHTGEKI